MDRMMKVKLPMQVRLDRFLRAHPFGDEPADEIVARFREKVARQQVYIALQEEGEAARTAQVAKHVAVRQKITRLPLRHLASLARAIEGEHPDIAAVIGKSVSHLTVQAFTAIARSVVGTIQSQHDLLRSRGMAEETVSILTTLLAEYEQAVDEADAGRRAHTGARAEMRALDRELMGLVRQLDGLVLIHFRDNPELLGAWKSARNVAWPAEEAVNPARIRPVVQPEERAS